MAADPRGPMTRGARHAFAALAVAVALVAGASPAFTVVYASTTARAQDKTIAQLRQQQAQLRAQQLAACAFAADLGGLPLPDKPRPSRLGVSLVADSRAQWRGLHCPGTLPVPPGLAKWARYYRLPAN